MTASGASARGVREAGIDAAALKPTECDLEAAVDLPVEFVTVDYEGREHLPDPEAVGRLAREVDVRMTAPVRADGFDPLGDDGRFGEYGGVEWVLVAGHPAYLTDEERSRAVAPRFGAALDRLASDDVWVGTEGVERLALATGAAQFELLSPTTERDLRSLRAAGFQGELAVYAPTVLADDRATVLEAVGGYVARREPVRRELPEGFAADGGFGARAERVLLDASDDWALTGGIDAVAERVADLKAAGADHVVGYPARGIAEFRPRG